MHRIRSGACVSCLISLFALGALSARAEPADEAREALGRLQQALETVAQAGSTLDFRGRYERLGPAIAATHDLEAMAADRVGDTWGLLETGQRRALVNAFFKRVTAGYAAEIGDGRLQGLRVGETTTLEDGSVGIDVEIAPPTSPPSVRTFGLRAEGGSWKIDRVGGPGIADPSEERRANEAAMEAGGFAALFEAFEDRIPRPDREAEARTPSQVVEALQAALIDTMRNAARLGYRGRYEKLAPIIEDTHHLPAIAQLTIRRSWDSLDEEQRRQFVQRFTALSIARYAARFDGYSGERFETLGEQEAGRGTLVRSTLIKSDGERIQFDYTLRRVGDRWRILNITVDGVSDLATKQAEYGAIFSRQGFRGLMATVEDQIRRQEAGT